MRPASFPRPAARPFHRSPRRLAGALALALVLALAGSAALAAAPAPGSPAGPHEQILRVVTGQVLGGQAPPDLRVVATREPFGPRHTYEFVWSGGPVAIPEGAAWFAIVDTNPGLMGFHPVTHVFLDDAFTIVERRAATFYPRLYVDGVRQGYETLVEFRTRPGVPPADRALVGQASSAGAPGAAPDGATEAGRGGAYGYNDFHAVIIEGDVPAGDSYSEFWTDPVSMFRLLLEYGYKPENVHVLYGEGHDEPNWPCTYYREQMVDFAAYHQDVRNLFTWMRDGNPEHGIPRVTDQDFVFLFTFDHGSGNSSCQAQLCLMDGCMQDTEFASYFNQIAYKHRAIDMQQCNSGGFIDNLQNAKTVISTAANCSESAWQADEQDACPGRNVKYGEWNYWWMSAMRGHKPWPLEQPVDADTDDDGKVSFAEAHNYALANDSQGEHPQWSDPGNLGNQLSLATTFNGPHLVHEAHVLEDAGGGAGNGDGVANPGETITIPVTLLNDGSQPASGVSAALRTDSPWIAVQDASALFPDLAAGGAGTSLPDHYRVAVDAGTPDDTSVSFALDWTANGTVNGTAVFTERVVRVLLGVQKTTVDDGAGGNGNGLADAGESFRLAVTLRDKGHADARQVRGTLATTSPYATITGAGAAWPDIPAQAAARSLEPHFGVTLAADTPAGTWIECTLDVTAADGFAATLPLRFIVGSRGTVLLVEDGDADEAGLLEPDVAALGFGVVREAAGESDPATWSGYDVVLWAAGTSATPAGTEGQRSALRQHVAGGGRLLVAGGDLASARRYDSTFMADVLHADYRYDGGGGSVAAADAAHPLATVPTVLPAELPIAAAGPADWDSATPQAAAAGARAPFRWTGTTAGNPVVSFDDDALEGNGGQVVAAFFAFRRLSRADDRVALLENALEWLLGNDRPYLLVAGRTIDDAGGGNGDGVADPGETVRLAIALRNEGSGTASHAWARAETDRPTNVTLLDNFVDWPAAAPGATATSLAPHLELRLAPGTPCGTVVTVTLHLTTSEGFAGDRVFSFTVGTGGGQHVTYEAPAMPVPIPNPGTLDNVITVPDAFRIADVNCGVKLVHSSTALIKVVLQDPAGKKVVLHDHDALGTTIDTVYDQFRPPHGPGSMSDYDGGLGQGGWHLFVTDFKGDMLAGQLQGWRLIFDTADLCHDHACSDAPPAAVDGSLRLTRLAGTDVRLTWAPAAGADGYNVWRCTRPDFSCPETAGATTSTTFDETGLPQAAPVYYYLVRGENGCHEEGP